MFTIEPFLVSTSFFPPGTMGNIEFTPDQAGEFKMLNVGHGFEGNFIVVNSVEEARIRSTERGIQEFSIIHDLDGGRMSPSTIVVQVNIPVKIYNTSLRGNEQVSIEPFYSPGEANLKEKEITTFEFIPNEVGEFPIRYKDHDIIGTLIVE